MPEAMKPVVERQIKELLDAGLIVRSDSPMASPLVCVAKKQGGVRLACDYRYVNSFTVADVFPLCTVDEMISKVGRGRYISLFDAKSGYWQFLVRPEDCWLTALVTNEGLYEWVALNRFRDIVYGAHITVFCDHNPLQYIRESATKSAKLLRWSLSLQEYDVEIKYTKGSQNVVADCLSRV